MSSDAGEKIREYGGLEVRAGGHAPPGWIAQTEWTAVVSEINCGFQFKRIWEERVQRYLRHARSEIHRYGRSEAEARIDAAIAQMQRVNQRKVSYLLKTLEQLRKRKVQPGNDREIQRKTGNPMLRDQRIGESPNQGEEQIDLLSEKEGKP